MVLSFFFSDVQKHLAKTKTQLCQNDFVKPKNDFVHVFLLFRTYIRDTITRFPTIITIIAKQKLQTKRTQKSFLKIFLAENFSKIFQKLNLYFAFG